MWLVRKFYLAIIHWSWGYSGGYLPSPKAAPQSYMFCDKGAHTKTNKRTILGDANDCCLEVNMKCHPEFWVADQNVRKTLFTRVVRNPHYSWRYRLLLVWFPVVFYHGRPVKPMKAFCSTKKHSECVLTETSNVKAIACIFVYKTLPSPQLKCSEVAEVYGSDESSITALLGWLLGIYRTFRERPTDTCRPCTPDLEKVKHFVLHYLDAL